ncbi:MAG TPA: hypothetical protein VHJ17_09510, partial [Thermomonospora sp.]|nr:hypothetical protein [Thermomonospora sp.]
PAPRITARADFVPTARCGDVHERVWHGFTRADRDTDRAGLRHVEYRRPTGGFPVVACPG